MQEIIESLRIVITDPGIWPSLGTTVAGAMFIGAMLNNGRYGLKTSLTVLLPYTIFLFIPTISRILHKLSDGTMVGASAWNGTITLFLVTVSYILGLTIGHLIIHRVNQEV